MISPDYIPRLAFKLFDKDKRNRVSFSKVASVFASVFASRTLCVRESGRSLLYTMLNILQFFCLIVILIVLPLISYKNYSRRTIGIVVLLGLMHHFNHTTQRMVTR